MKLGVCIQALYHLSFDDALRTVKELDVAGFELPVDRRSPCVDLDALLAGGVDGLRQQLETHGLEITAISNHQESQLLLGPHHADTDAVFAGNAEEKIAHAQERLHKSARLAQELGVDKLVGFVGCEDWSRFFPWPAADGWERMLPTLRERMLPLLDTFADLGVRFAHEPHPKQIVYNTETALESVDALDGHPAWGFNLDPANLLIAGVDPLCFVRELSDRIVHVHAKDGELVQQDSGRSGLLAHGAWDRKGRGFRFRIPGWGDVPWKRFLSELRMGGYDGWLTIENEDPVFHPVDGLRKAIAELRPLLPDGPRMERWW